MSNIIYLHKHKLPSNLVFSHTLLELRNILQMAHFSRYVKASVYSVRKTLWMHGITSIANRPYSGRPKLHANFVINDYSVYMQLDGCKPRKRTKQLFDSLGSIKILVLLRAHNLHRIDWADMVYCPQIGQFYSVHDNFTLMDNKDI